MFPGAETGEDPATAGTQRNIFAAGQLANILALVLGTLAVTGEYRFGTIASTFLAEPRRWRVIVAKLVATASVGTVLAAAAAVVTLIVAPSALRINGETMVLPSDEIGSLLAWPIAQAPAYAMVGVAAGLIVRSQVGALVGLFLWGSSASRWCEPSCRASPTTFHSRRSVRSV